MVSYPHDFQHHIVGVGGYIVKNDQVLLIKTTYGHSKFVIPGGFVEKGETLEEAVIREVKEETNLDIEPVGIMGIRTMVQEHHMVSDFYVIISCSVVGDTELIRQEDEIAEIAWIDIADISTNEEVSVFTRYVIEKLKDLQPMTKDHKISEMRKKSRNILKNEQYWSNEKD